MMDKLPEDLLIHYVCSSLSPKELLHFSLSCRAFRHSIEKIKAIPVFSLRMTKRIKNSPSSRKIFSQIHYLESNTDLRWVFRPARIVFTSLIGLNLHSVDRDRGNELLEMLPNSKLKFLRIRGFCIPQTILDKFEHQIEYINLGWQIDAKKFSSYLHLKFLIYSGGNLVSDFPPQLVYLSLDTIVEFDSWMWETILSGCRQLKFLNVVSDKPFGSNIFSIISTLLDPLICPTLKALSLQSVIITVPWEGEILRLHDMVGKRPSLEIFISTGIEWPEMSKKFIYDKIERSFILKLNPPRICSHFVYVGGEKIFRVIVELVVGSWQRFEIDF